MEKQKIIDFVKKKWKYFAIILAVIIVIIYVVCREKHIANMAAATMKDKMEIVSLQDQRDRLISENDKLIKEEVKNSHEKDSLITALERLRKELAIAVVKHQHEIDSLLDIPNDSIFVRLQPIFPNYYGDLLKYRFSGSQIRQIYTTAISYPMLQQEYGLQTKQLSTCNLLTQKYQQSELNYKAQVDNLNQQITNCDTQLGIKDKQIDKNQKKLNRKTFWNWTDKGVIVVIATLFFLK